MLRSRYNSAKWQESKRKGRKIPMQSEVLSGLLTETWKSHIFGDAFGEDVLSQKEVVMEQIGAIAVGASKDLAGYITFGMPEWDAAMVQKVVGQIIPKTVGFCPALAAGEVQDLARLQAVSVAIGLMYWGDQTMDRGDEAMPFAIEVFAKEKLVVPDNIRDLVVARSGALGHIEAKIAELARPEDAPYVLACFREQVLLNEVRLHRLSHRYLQATDKDAFLVEHGKSIAQYMTVDAGFPSVSSSLYAIYRQADEALPSLQEVYENKTMVELLQICNSVVRVADELGDWKVDAGQHLDWGVFCINLFNQPHPALLDEFLQLAKLADNQQLRTAFVEFHQDKTQHETHGDYIMGVFFDHVKSYIANLSPEIQDKYGLYIRLCKRVLEIGYVNRVGDIALAGKKENEPEDTSK